MQCNGGPLGEQHTHGLHTSLLWSVYSQPILYVVTDSIIVMFSPGSGSTGSGPPGSGSTGSIAALSLCEDSFKSW